MIGEPLSLHQGLFRIMVKFLDSRTRVMRDLALPKESDDQCKREECESLVDKLFLASSASTRS